MSLMLGTTKIASKNVTGDTLPIGGMLPWTSDTIPENWLLCNGQAISRTTYSLLYAVIGTTYGTGDGSTTFNVPDMRDYVPVGKSSTDANINALGKKYGSQTVTLDTTMIPSHQHTFKGIKDVINTDSDGGGAKANNGQGNNYGYNTPNTELIGSTGGGQAHNNMQKSIATNYIIKAFQSSGVVATVVDNVTSTSTINALSANQGKVLNDKITTINGKLKAKVTMSSTSLTTTGDTQVMSYTIPSGTVGTIKVLILYITDINVNSALVGCNICINVGGYDKARNYSGIPTSGAVWGHHITCMAMEDVTANTVISFKAQKDNSSTVSVTDRTTAFIIEL